MKSATFSKMCLAVFSLIFLSSSIFASEKLVYKLDKFLAKARVVFEAKEGIYQEKPVILIDASVVAKAFGSVMAKFQAKSINQTELFDPMLNVQCNQKEQTCFRNQFLDEAFVLYSEYEDNVVEIKELEKDAEGVNTINVKELYPDFDPATDPLFDMSAMMLTLRRLEYGPSIPHHEFYIAMKDEIGHITVGWHKDLGNNRINLKITNLEDSPEEIEEYLPSQMVFNRKYQVITKISGKVEEMGSYTLKLDLSESELGQGLAHLKPLKGIMLDDI